MASQICSSNITSCHVLSIALDVFRNSTTNTCAFEEPPCLDPGFIPELSSIGARLLSPFGYDNTAIRFVKAKGYSLTEGGNQSVLDFVLNEKVDMSSIDAGLSARRSQILEHVGPIMRRKSTFVYNQTFREIPTLRLIRNQWETYLVILLFGSSLLALRSFLQSNQHCCLVNCIPRNLIKRALKRYG